MHFFPFRRHLCIRYNSFLRHRFWEIAVATIEDLAFGIRSSREPDRVGRRVCLSGALRGVKKIPSLCSEQASQSHIIKYRMENGVKNLKGARLFPKTFSNSQNGDAYFFFNKYSFLRMIEIL
jgi:hypothetical protein